MHEYLPEFKSENEFHDTRNNVKKEKDFNVLLRIRDMDEKSINVMKKNLKAKASHLAVGSRPPPGQDPKPWFQCHDRIGGASDLRF